MLTTNLGTTPSASVYLAETVFPTLDRWLDKVHEGFHGLSVAMLEQEARDILSRLPGAQRADAAQYLIQSINNHNLTEFSKLQHELENGEEPPSTSTRRSPPMPVTTSAVVTHYKIVPQSQIFSAMNLPESAAELIKLLTTSRLQPGQIPTILREPSIGTLFRNASPEEQAIIVNHACTTLNLPVSLFTKTGLLSTQKSYPELLSALIRSGSKDAVLLLLQEGIRNHWSLGLSHETLTQSPLAQAVLSGDISLMQALWKAGYSISKKFLEFNPAGQKQPGDKLIDEVIRHGNLSGLKFLNEAGFLKPLKSDGAQWGAAMVCAINAHHSGANSLEIFKSVLKMRPNFGDTFSWGTPNVLRTALENKQSNLLEALLGINYSEKSAGRQHAKRSEYLTHKHILGKDSTYHFPLEFSILNRDLESTTTLLDMGAPLRSGEFDAVTMINAFQDAKTKQEWLFKVAPFLRKN
jgi:hypothetical protein